MNTILQAISKHLTKHNIQHNTEDRCIIIKHQVILTKYYRSNIHQTGNDTILLRDFSTTLQETTSRDIIYQTQDPQLFPKLLHQIQQAIQQIRLKTTKHLPGIK
jgi:hypothetical protein